MKYLRSLEWSKRYQFNLHSKYGLIFPQVVKGIENMVKTAKRCPKSGCVLA
jgi:hypothetical protein